MHFFTWQKLVSAQEILYFRLMIRVLTPADLEAYMAIRRDSFTKAPLAFSQLPDEEIDPERTRQEMARWHDENFMLAYFSTQEEKHMLAGIMGLMRYTAPKRRHRACLWGVYVREEAQGQGIAKQLLAETLKRCREMEGLERVILTVSHHAKAAIALYESVGFVQFGCELGAARTGDIPMNEIYYLLDL